MKAKAQILLSLICIAILFYPIVYWFEEPHLTQMQIFIETWWSYAIGIPLYIIGLYLIDKLFKNN